MIDWDYVIIGVGIAGIIGILTAARKVQRLEVGGLYSVVASPREFGVVKLLAHDRKGVHIRLYNNRYPKRPNSVAPESLSLGAAREGDRPGIGHLPLLKRHFYRWLPIRIGHAPVTEEELEGYLMWKEAEGGYWE